jgi:hypothetical protein
MVSMSANTLPAEFRDDRSLHQVISAEIAAVQTTRTRLMTEKSRKAAHYVVLFCCILVNVVFFLIRADYFAIFIAASFYLNMFYFITLLIPTTSGTAKVPMADIPRFLSWLKEIGVKSGTSRFTRLFMNSFFINSRALSLGIGLIFAVDILFTLIAYIVMDFSVRITVIVILQCAVIIAFYVLVWKIEPYSVAYIKNVEQVKDRLSQTHLPLRVITALFMTGIVVSVFLFMTTIILLPGMTVNAFLTQSGLAGLGHLVSLIAVLAASQYFVIRYIHGITSRALALRLLTFRENGLREILREAATEKIRPDTQGKNPYEITTALLESRIYQVRKSSLYGAFPVFIVNLDFSVILDSTTLTAIRGYIGNIKQ